VTPLVLINPSLVGSFSKGDQFKHLRVTTTFGRLKVILRVRYLEQLQQCLDL